MTRSILVLLVAAGCGDSASGDHPGAADATAAQTDAGGLDSGSEPDGASAPSVVVFDNTDGAFVWTPEDEYEGDVITTGAYLDLTLAAGSQSGEVSASAIYFKRWWPSGLGTRGGFSFSSYRWYEPGEGGADFAAGEDFILSGSHVDVMIVPPLAKSTGDAVGPDDRWEYGVQAAHFQDPGDNTPPDTIWFTGGTIGVRFDAGDGVHYGFVELALDMDENLQLSRYRPVRWGYETRPDTPLVIPP